MNPSKQKGTAAETAVVGFLRAEGALHAERRALSGVLDCGDVSGIPGVCIEVKNQNRDSLPAWVNEMTAETHNARADLGFVWHKRRGMANPGNWFVTCTGYQATKILRKLGYIPPVF